MRRFASGMLGTLRKIVKAPFCSQRMKSLARPAASQPPPPLQCQYPIASPSRKRPRPCADFFAEAVVGKRPRTDTSADELVHRESGAQARRNLLKHFELEANPFVRELDACAPKNDPVRTKNSQEDWKAKLEAIYQQHNPVKLDTVSKMLEKYQGREAHLYRKVCDFYKVDPSTGDPKVQGSDERPTGSTAAPKAGKPPACTSLIPHFSRASLGGALVLQLPSEDQANMSGWNAPTAGEAPGPMILTRPAHKANFAFRLGADGRPAAGPLASTGLQTINAMPNPEQVPAPVVPQQIQVRPQLSLPACPQEVQPRLSLPAYPAAEEAASDMDANLTERELRQQRPLIRGAFPPTPPHNYQTPRPKVGRLPAGRRKWPPEPET